MVTRGGARSTGGATIVKKILRTLVVVPYVALCLFPGSNNVQLYLAKAATSGVCVTEGQACFGDDTCTACITTIGTTGASQSECAEQYSFDDETGDDNCDLFGVAYCCAAALSGLECLKDETTLAYWSCVLENIGCTLDGMPCLDGATDLAADSSADAAADNSGAMGVPVRSCSVPQLVGALGFLVAVAGKLM